MIPQPPSSTLFLYTTLFRSPFRGTLTQTSVYPREIVKAALAANAAAVIFAHNHPSGVAQPSQRDGCARRRSEEHTSELQSHSDLVCRLLLEKKKNPLRFTSV